MLRGDEVGALLERTFCNAGTYERTDGQLHRLLPAAPAAMCRAAGVEHVETLTGFKWISRVPGLAFG